MRMPALIMAFLYALCCPKPEVPLGGRTKRREPAKGSNKDLVLFMKAEPLKDPPLNSVIMMLKCQSKTEREQIYKPHME